MNGTERPVVPPSAAQPPVAGVSGPLNPPEGRTGPRIGDLPFVDSWLAAREALAQIDREAHPDVTDRFGRVWSWQAEIGGTGRARGRYVHDGVFSQPTVELVHRTGLAPVGLARNPNYATLCGICRRYWPADTVWPPVPCRGCWKVNRCECGEAS